MKLIDQFERADPTPEDTYTFVFDTQQDGQNDMLMMGEDGFRHGYWTRGPYDPDGANAHLGNHVELHELGNAVLNAFFYRLSIPQGYEDFEDFVEEMAQVIEADDGTSEGEENDDDGENLPPLLDRVWRARNESPEGD